MRELNYLLKEGLLLYKQKQNFKILLLFFMVLFIRTEIIGQCTTVPNEISGTIYEDLNYNGIIDLTDSKIEGVKVLLYDNHQKIVSETISKNDGYFSLAGLTNNTRYRIEFIFSDDYALVKGEKVVRIIEAPSCGVDLLLHKPYKYRSSNPEIVMSMFYQGTPQQYPNSSVVFSLDNNFNNTSTVNRVLRKSDVGSTWGLTFSRTTQQLFTSAFIKQYAYLGSGGLGAIYSSKRTNSSWETSLFVDLTKHGIDVGKLKYKDAQVCEYGAQVGKIGLGAIALSEDEKYLYTTNLYKNELIKIPLDKSKFNEIESIPVPIPNCIGGYMHAFALKSYKGKLYIGVTCGAEISKDEENNIAHVYEYNPSSGIFTLIFSTDYPKGSLHDTPTFDVKVQHWLTDIDFTDEGNMVIVLNDRVGQRYCRGKNGRLDSQNGDILLVWNDKGTWKLEKNGRAGILRGTGIGNGEGPGGGEFFGEDAWPTNPSLHPETSTGSVFALEGTGEVIVPVYDPEKQAYSGGLKKFNSSNGTQTAVYSIYSHKTFPQMGKASGFGDLEVIYDPLPVEIGDYIWLDSDNDGIQDPNENGIANLSISLYDDNCNKVGTTVTDANGYYVFNETNVDLNNDGIFDGIDLLNKYFVVLDDNNFKNNKLEVGSEILYLTVLNRGVGNNNDENDNDSKIARGVCDAFNGKPYVEVFTKGSGLNRYDVDFGFSRVEIFDLALRKVLVDNTTVHYGDKVQFKVTVYNQGTLEAHDIEVLDYINKGFEVDPLDNPQWEFDGNVAKYIYTSILKPGESFDVFIEMNVGFDAGLEDLVNYAEISSALDPNGNLGADVDSTPDSIEGNDIGGIAEIEGANYVLKTDDLIDDDGTFDEDDHDPAMVKILDLALQKIVVSDKLIYVFGDTVTFSFKIFNQGNVIASKYSIVDYLNEELIFDQKLNPGWIKKGTDIVQYDIDEELPPFSQKIVDIKFIISDKADLEQILNYGEISKIQTNLELNPKDYDSVPNSNKNDDVGANIGTSTDNQINSSPLSLIADEDDQDVASIKVFNYDLALVKKALNHDVEKGDDVKFEIEIFNQGSITADKITIVDYIENGFVLKDNKWSIYPGNNNKAEITLSVANGLLPPVGLLPNKSVKINITLLLEDIPSAVNFMKNKSEIKSSFDIAGNNLGLYDKDSTPDDIDDNDIEGLDNQLNGDGTNDEDDHDWASVFVRTNLIFDPCICLHNATNEEDGQFRIDISIVSPPGENWVIDSIVNFYDLASPPPAPIEYAIGTPMVENLNDPEPGLSTYSISGIQVDDVVYFVRFKNNLGDIQIIHLVSGVCSYDNTTIIGTNGTCHNAVEDYSILNPDPTTTYTWTLSGGGNIIGPNIGTDIKIQWGNGNGSYELEVSASGGSACIAPKKMNVKVGNSSGALAIDDYVISSVDDNCELEVTPEVIISTPVNPNTPFSIILIDPQGIILPSNVITSDYIGMDILVKIIDQCSGQEGKSIVKAVDKIKPQFDCVDAIVDCDDMTNYLGPIVTDNCDSNPEVLVVNETVDMQDCASPFTKIITREYVAKDKWGNTSDKCVQHISVNRLNKADVVFPESYLVSDNSALTCNSFALDEDGNPDPKVTGTPFYHGKDLYTICTNNFCETSVGYYDVVTFDNGCVKKILRTWQVIENCETITLFNIISAIQTIEIHDLIPPIPVAPNDMLVTTNGLNCSSTIEIPALEIKDNCSDEFKVNVFYPGGNLINSNGGVITLPLGVNNVIYKVYDKCDNLTEVDMKVTVKDGTPPVAVCQTSTVVSLTTTGEADVPALSFNSGSYDDCGIIDFSVRRMFGGSFGKTVHFGCDDLDSTGIMVVLRVKDSNDNWNECMVNVNVQHKFPPVIKCPKPLTVECDYNYTDDNLAKYFGEATGFDVCGVTVNEGNANVSINQCGVGSITRHFTATGRGGLQKSCSQKITFVNSSLFSLNDITWPDDVMTVSTCGSDDLSPDVLGRPVLNEDQCDLVSFVYEDQIFYGIQGDACYSVIRTWKVIDECQKVNGKFKTWEFDQLIHVTNEIDPFINILTDIDTCTFDSNCKTGNVILEAEGSDDCTLPDDFQWKYEIDLYSDGTIDDSKYQVGAKAVASGEYPIGTHTILWVLEDRCGNSFARSQKFVIKNCKKPTAICKDALIVELGPTLVDGDTTGVADILAELFNNGSSHSCGFPVSFSYSLDVNDTILYLDCSWIKIDTHSINIYVTDSLGNVDFCTTHLIVQDNNYICDPFDRCIDYPLDSVVIEACNANLDPEHGFLDSLFVDGSCGCDDFEITYTDTDVSDGTNTCRSIERQWDVDFNCTDLDTTITYIQKITLKNVSAPELTCPANITVDASVNCDSYVLIPVPTYDPGTCNTGLAITHNSIYADANGENASGTYPGGTTTVAFTLTDDCGNDSQCSLDVIVVDGIPPECISNDTIVALDANGSVTITSDFVASESTDNCGISTINIDPSSFDCSNIGNNTVNIIVTDSNNNESTCTATVTIIDTLTQLCNANDTVLILDGNGELVLDPEDIYSGSGGCGGSADVSLDANPDSFDCGDLGENTVQLIVTDNVTGESDTCEAIVTITDTIAPICLVKNDTVFLDINGGASITFDDIDNGSSDPCGDIVDTTLSKTTFDCSEVSVVQEVIVTLKDNNDNTSTCTSQITVKDTISPTCSAIDTIKVYLDSSGEAEIEASDVDDGSSDQCGNVTLAVAPDQFSCSDAGDTLAYVLTVTDASGNESNCGGFVVVIDTLTQLCNAHDTTLVLDENGEGVLDPFDIYNGSGCGGSANISLVAEPDSFDCDDLGINIVQLIVTDNITGESDTCEANVTVTDTIAPQCLVNNDTVYLDGNGNGSLEFADINNGSFDPCGEIVDTTLSDDSFICTDISTVQNITVTLTDNNGNVSTCLSEITVLDTIAPTCSAIDTLYVPLDDTGMAVITGQNVDAGSFDQCLDISLNVEPDTFYCNDASNPVIYTLTVSDLSGNESQCSGVIIVQDTTPPTIVCPNDTVISCLGVPDQSQFLDEFGEPVIFDNCSQGGDYVETDIINIDNCGAGAITRNFSISDQSGNTSECTQLITVEAEDDNFSEDDITWPEDTIIVENCFSTHPDSLNSRPIVNTDNAGCADITTTYEDTNLTPGGSCNDTIQRIWTVVDSCKFDADPNTGIFIDTQTIIVFDTLAPIIFAPTDTIVFVTDEDCSNDEFVNLFGYVVDCDPNVVVTNDSPHADNNNSADASGTYPQGNYDIKIIATDQCGNSDTAEYNIIVSFPKYCTKTIVSIGEGDSVIVFVEQVVTDHPDCADFSFSETDPDVDSTVFYCPDLGDNLTHVYKFNPSGDLLDSCKMLITVNDPDGFCTSPFVAGIFGNIKTEDGFGVQDAEILLSGNGNSKLVSNIEGRFEFTPLDVKKDYKVKPSKNDDLLNGVNTLDVYHIQKHLLGIKKLNSPYKMIAADINNNNKITASDILQLRKAILGEVSQFNNNESWKFVDSKYEFENIKNPFNNLYPQDFEANNINHKMKADFIGVKIGDVDHSVLANALMNVESRSIESLDVFVDDEKVSSDETISVPIKVVSDSKISGIQFTFNFDPNYLELVEVMSPILDLNENNIGYKAKKRGRITLSWNQMRNIDLYKNDELIIVKFNVIKTGNLSKLIKVTSDITSKLVFDENSIVKDFQLGFRSEGINTFVLYQNEPNPWSYDTRFRFDLPQQGEVKVKITNSLGAIVDEFTLNGLKGVNSVVINKNRIKYSGLLFVDFGFNGKHLVKRMIKLK